MTTDEWMERLRKAEARVAELEGIGRSTALEAEPASLAEALSSLQRWRAGARAANARALEAQAERDEARGIIAACRKEFHQRDLDATDLRQAVVGLFAAHRTHLLRRRKADKERDEALKERHDFANRVSTAEDRVYVLQTERDAAQARCDELVGLLRKACPLCHGQGDYLPHCGRCADSTDDHECPERVRCTCNTDAAKKEGTP